jgi:hypothetical protein
MEDLLLYLERTLAIPNVGCAATAEGTWPISKTKQIRRKREDKETD